MNKILDILKSINAIVTNDHFVYTSGKHGSVYVRKDMLYPHTGEVSKVGEFFAQKFKDSSIEVVVGPAVGGIILSQWTAHHLSQLTNKDILSLFTEKVSSPDQLFNKDQQFKRGYDALVTDKNVLIVEDLTTTGGSIKRVVETVKKAKGNIVAVSVMVDRSPKNEPITEESLGAPFKPLEVLPTEVYDAEKCPLCKKNVPINTTVGHGKEFLESRK